MTLKQLEERERLAYITGDVRLSRLLCAIIDRWLSNSSWSR